MYLEKKDKTEIAIQRVQFKCFTVGMYGQELQNLDHFNPIALKMAKTLLTILSARGLNLIQLNYKYWYRNTKIKQSTSRSDLGLQRLQNIINVYASARKRNNSV